MKYVLFLFGLVSYLGLSQHAISFEDDSDVGYSDFFIDTISNPDNIWQIGPPQKTFFNEAASMPNVIVTDTLNSYPINDTSSFIIKHQAFQGFTGWGASLEFNVSVQTDSLNDYGKIEFSPDNGESWVLISDDTLTYFSPSSGEMENWPFYGFSVPALTGKSSWTNFTIYLGGVEEIFDIAYYDDTVQFRFTFISDGVGESLDGLMYDDIIIWDPLLSDIDELSTSAIELYPNPVNSTLFIREVPTQDFPITVNLYNQLGQKLSDQHFEQQGGELELDCSSIPRGLYFYQILNEENDLLKAGKLEKF